ncbi:MAG TPA: patatin-like phospholipase family protein [Anaerolineales bacterium]|nr:patatin-like phospholipase family protein [Anaerolineales bacterium]
MNQQTTFVFGGGGARGALQVGALQALLEAGFRPDLVVGSSAGAINAAFLAIHGFSRSGLLALAAAWLGAAEADLLPANYVGMTLRAILRRGTISPVERIREFLVANGVQPDLRFGDIRQPKLAIVSSDLGTGTPVIHGQSPEDCVLDALLLSTALPPWSMPVRRHGRYLMDGAVVSSLPIEPALQCGATDIVALDLIDPREPFGPVNGFGTFLNQVTYAVQTRMVKLEMELAAARGVPVFYMLLSSRELVHIWDFAHTAELILQGHASAKSAIADYDRMEAPPGRARDA